ncbi:hypothetical protein CANCADRAFT_12 [Tortispora caseinolytica NRRL Y-17796]|uniref:Uncharacterized protein n=1 Tax=Tortispora caseinolytica NRRL Y-17796 TaxID=767744 RepID=A0A1E4TI58_9ASCO|nr:hypothetical protein CANCADRAFT_12 [Tortispora caseinolytica NRRL Y-17796]
MSDSDSDQPAVQSLVSGREKRSTAGNRLRTLLDAQEPLDDDEIFMDIEGDDDFPSSSSETAGESEPEDVVMDDVDEDANAVGEVEESDTLGDTDQNDDENISDSESDPEDGAQSDDESGEKELQRREKEAAKERRLKARKQRNVAPVVRKAASATKPTNPRVSALKSLGETRRSSGRATTIKNKQEVLERLKISEERHKENMKRIAKANRPEYKEMTQEERLKEAEETEKLNTQYLEDFYKQEFERKKRQRDSFLSKRKRLTEYIRFRSHIADIPKSALAVSPYVLKVVEVEEKQQLSRYKRRKLERLAREKAEKEAAEEAAKEAAKLEASESKSDLLDQTDEKTANNDTEKDQLDLATPSAQYNAATGDDIEDAQDLRHSHTLLAAASNLPQDLQESETPHKEAASEEPKELQEPEEILKENETAEQQEERAASNSASVGSEPVIGYQDSTKLSLTTQDDTVTKESDQPDDIAHKNSEDTLAEKDYRSAPISGVKQEPDAESAAGEDDTVKKVNTEDEPKVPYQVSTISLLEFPKELDDYTVNKVLFGAVDVVNAVLPVKQNTKKRYSNSTDPINGLPAKFRDPHTEIGYSGISSYRRLQELHTKDLRWSWDIAEKGGFWNAHTRPASQVPKRFLECYIGTEDVKIETGQTENSES